MFRVKLVNLPFADIERPSIGLTQLKGVVNEQFGDQVQVEIVYLNHDIAQHFDRTLYNSIAGEDRHLMRGLGEWLFRQVAFPTCSDNAYEYFQRFYPRTNPRSRELQKRLEAKRASLEEVLKTLVLQYRLNEADVLGVTSVFAQNNAGFAVARLAKQLNPSVITVMGGANCETDMGKQICASIPSLDYVFSGPSLKSFPKFIELGLHGAWEECSRVPGVLSKTNCNDPIMPGKMFGGERDINDTVPLDYRSFFDSFDKKFPNSEFVLPFETSRGCWWGEKAHCTFCGLNGESMAHRSMSPENAIRQIKSLFQYSERCTTYAAVDNIMPRSYVQDVLPFIEAPAKSTMFYEVKADLSEVSLATLARAGVRRIQPGIESLATSTLKLMKKGTTAFQNIQFLKNCVKHGIRPEWNLLIGFPGEQSGVYEKYDKDLPALTHLRPPAGVYPVRFDRFSPYHTRPKEFGLELRPAPFYQYVFPLPDSAIGNMAYYFEDRNYGAPYMISMIEWIDRLREKHRAWQNLWRPSESHCAPRLFLKRTAEKAIVIDSRGGKCLEHPLDADGLALLERLENPRTIRQLDSDLAWGADKIRCQISRLQDARLLFEEGDHYLSLVLPEEHNAC